MHWTELNDLLGNKPRLFMLSKDADESTWGRSHGFPIVLFASECIDGFACEYLFDDFMDILDEMEEPLFDEGEWLSERFAPIGLLGVFDEPDAPTLGDEFPFVAQMDGLLLWDAERETIVLFESDVDPDGLDSLQSLAATGTDFLVAISG